MAAPRENLLSLGHLTSKDRNTFTKQREHSLKKSRVKNLQQRWQELRERELTAQQHNRQLLQQFEEAQGTLREMLTLTTAMKTIRMEYEQYLEDSAPRWQQQLEEKTQAAQRKRMEEYLKSHLKNAEDHLTKSSADQPLLSQGLTIKPQNNSATQKHYNQNCHLDYNQDGSPHLPYMQSSLQTHPRTQTAWFPIRAPHHPQGSSHSPPSLLPPPIFSHPFQLHHLSSTPAHHHPWPRQNLPGRVSPQPDYPWSWTVDAAGIPSGSEALWDRLYTEEPPAERGVAQVVEKEAETSRLPSSKKERGGGSRSSHLFRELDIKPVRLSSDPAERSESSRESCQTSREKRKKRGKSSRTSSDRERCSPQESLRTSSAIVTAAVTAAQNSESDTSLEKGRTSTSRRRSAGLAVGSPRAETVVKERNRSNEDDSGRHKEESQSTAEESRSEEAEDRSPNDKSESCREESGSQREEDSGSVSIKIENGGADEIEKKSSNSEESSEGEKDDKEEEHEKDLGEGDQVNHNEEREDSRRDEEQEQRDVEDDEEASERKNTTEEEEEQESEDEMEEQEPEEESGHEEKSNRLKNEDGENAKRGSASSQDEEVDEDESEGREDKMEEDGESGEEEEEGGGEEEEEPRIDEAGKAEEERDSEDSIISPQNKSKKMHIIVEEASEDEEEEGGSKTGSCDDDANEFSDEDIEHLLAPQEQSQKKEEKDLKAVENPKAICDKVEVFQVELDRSTTTDHPSDSEEFDHFYD